MAQSKRQAQLSYLINLGFNISTKTNSKSIQTIYNSIQALGESLKNVGDGIDLPVENAISSLKGPMTQLQGYLDKVSQNLNEMYRDQAMTFQAMRDGTIDVARAFGDLAKAQAKIDQSGWGDYSLMKSKAANANFPTLSLGDTIDMQNAAYTKELTALGDDTEKTLIKLGIQDSLEKVNADTAQFLQANLGHIEDFVERSRMMYDSDGKAIGSWVKIRLAAGKSLEISQKYFDQTITTANGDVTSRIGVRTSQQVTTDRTAALKEVQRALTENYNLQRKISEARQQGNDKLADELEKQRQLIEYEKLKQSYLAAYEGKGIVSSTNRASKEIDVAEAKAQQEAYQNIIKYTRQIEDLKTKQIKASGIETAEIDKQIDALQQKITAEREIVTLTGKALTSEQEESIKHISAEAQTKQDLESLKKNLSDLESNYKQLLDVKKKAMTSTEGSTQKQYYDDLAITIEKNITEIGNLIQKNGQAAAAAKQLAQITDNYAEKIEEIQAVQATKKDEQSIKNTIEAYKKLLKAQEEYEKLRQRRASKSALIESKNIVDELQDKYDDLSSSVLSNGQAVEKNSEFVEQHDQLLKDHNTTLRKLENGLDSNSDSLYTLSQRFKMTIENVIKYKLAQYGLEEALQKSVQTIKELDKAITNIRLVTGETATTVRQTINEYAELAKELGTTTEAVSSGSIEWLCKRSCKISLTAGNSLEINILNYYGNINNGLTNY